MFLLSLIDPLPRASCGPGVVPGAEDKWWTEEAEDDINQIILLILSISHSNENSPVPGDDFKPGIKGSREELGREQLLGGHAVSSRDVYSTLHNASHPVPAEALGRAYEGETH